MRNKQGETGGWVRRLLAGSGFHCTVYNVCIIYTFLSVSVLQSSTTDLTADSLYCSLSAAAYEQDALFHDQKRQNYHIS